MEENYILILKDSLQKKVGVLEEISRLNKRQKDILLAEQLDDQAFEDTIHRKGELIEQLTFLDSGFEKMYQRVKEILSGQKGQYAQEIASMQECIRRITELTLLVQSEEQENKQQMTARFSRERKQIRQSRTSNATATKYYQTMSKLNIIDPQFMDKKK